MNSKSARAKRAKRTKGEGRNSMTADEVMLRFFPFREAQRPFLSGKELGAEVAERTFAGISGARLVHNSASKP